MVTSSRSSSPKWTVWATLDLVSKTKQRRKREEEEEKTVFTAGLPLLKRVGKSPIVLPGRSGRVNRHEDSSWSLPCLTEPQGIPVALLFHLHGKWQIHHK